MSRRQLQPDILNKMAERSDKSQQYLREQISRKAGRLGISSVAAQLIWARELGIGIAGALNRLPTEVREEIRSVTIPSAQSRARKVAEPVVPKRKAAPITVATINTLFQDEQLRARCKDLLQAKKHFDRVIREATTLLDDRLKTKTGITNMNPENLVGKALNPDPNKAIIEVSAEKSEQEGFYSICKGIMLAFRNRSHHRLSDKFTREDALKFCGFVDTVLAVIEQARIHPERA